MAVGLNLLVNGTGSRKLQENWYSSFFVLQMAVLSLVSEFGVCLVL